MKIFLKDKLIPSLFGGLLGVILSQAVAFYSLHENFELVANRDRLNNLKWELSLLRSVQSEMEFNTKILINQGPYSINYISQPKKMDIPNIGDPVVKEFAKVFLGMNGKYFEVTNLTYPKEELISTAWRPPVFLFEGQFELAKDLDNFYNKLANINRSVMEIKSIYGRWGTTLPEDQFENIRNLKDKISENVKYISKDNIVDMNMRIGKEIRRLEELKSKLST